MDVILYLSPESIALFHMKALVELMKETLEKYGYRGFLDVLEKNGGRAALSFEVLNGLPYDSVKYENTDNPFNRRWTRMKGRRKFQKGSMERTFPPESDLKTSLLSQEISSNKAYITNGYEAAGSYASVYTLVAYNGHLGVIKSMEDVSVDLFELITQAYLCENLKLKSYRHIKVPEIYFIQKKMHRERVLVDVFMSRAKGNALSDIARRLNTDVLVALAHVCKSLWHLQRDFQFMHRDLSGANVFYDALSLDVTFIDFGMTCINPTNRHHAWQSNNDDFYEQYTNSNGSQCTNRSLDLCILIAQLSYTKHIWCVAEHEKMKNKMKEVIDNSDNRVAIEKLRKKIRFTDISKDNWQPGNNSREHDGAHWWLYNMVEFPLEDWYPAMILPRLLRNIPFKHWFGLRKNWRATFQDVMPKDMRVRINNYADITYVGKEGMVTGLFGRNQLSVLVEGKKINVPEKDCVLVL